MKRHIVAKVEEIPVGQRKEVRVGGKSICIFNVNGEFYAIRNVCPHQGAPLFKGSIGGIHICGDAASGTVDEVRLIKKGEILRCPWHGWEFDIKTGESIFDPQDCYVKKYEVTVGVQVADRLSVETYSTEVESNWVIIRM
ncbi:Rieske (2Fe-2S) protein [Peribacillus frigoritolerans]|uniref:Rieske (2Fe-2S) protein n=1 Tax=Peribacillus frigoritolerans TaxID=450367 RepID=UPI003F7F955F